MFLACEGFDVAALFREEGFIAVTAITMGCATAMLWIAGATIASIAQSRARETTRREMAAYVSEGSIKPEDAVAMLNAGGKGKSAIGDVS